MLPLDPWPVRVPTSSAGFTAAPFSRSVPAPRLLRAQVVKAELDVGAQVNSPFLEGVSPADRENDIK